MTTKNKLTQRQQDVFDFILGKIRSRGYGPTVREIGNQFEIRSPNGVMCHLQALVKKGLIRREPNMSRAISLVDMSVVDNRPAVMTPASATIPLAGLIAAGLPLETFEQQEQVDLAAMFVREGYFALKVRGESMIDDHIEDGDYVIIRKQETARNGQIVVALVDGAETTLKRFYKEGSRYRLEPANASMSSIYADKVDVLGVVVGVVRQYALAN